MNPKIIMRNKTLTQEEVEYLQELHKDSIFCNIDYLTLQILYTRGVKTKEEMRFFLYGNLNDLSDPSKMKDSNKFCTIVIEAIKNNEDIVIYTDYDMDGIGCAMVAVSLLRRYAELVNSTSNIYWYANSRFIEGYGITKNGVNDLMNKYPTTKLIITTDNGIKGYEGVQRAKDLNLKIIVTDHHQEGLQTVNADAIIDPHQKDDNSDFEDLCGAGVIYQLLRLLYKNEGLDVIEEVDKYVDIVALSTVADLVPLNGDNRLIVKEGLKKANLEINPMFKILREAFNTITVSESAMIKRIDEETFGFNYGPAFNSIGRLEGTIDKAMEFYFEQDEEKRMKLAIEIFQINQRRKELTTDANSKMYERILQKYPNEDSLPSILIEEDDTIEEGIIGLVATFIKDTFHRPAIIFTKVYKKDSNGKIIDEFYKGSARSIDDFDITKSFDANNQYLLGYGGHKAAGGLSCSIQLFNDFIKNETSYASSNITPDMYVPKIYVDFALTTSQVTEDICNTLEQAKPYGMNFPKPKVGISNFVVDRSRYKIQDWESPFCGADKQTVRLVDTSGFTAVMFKHREQFEKILNQYTNLDNVYQIPVKMIGNPKWSYNSFTNSYKAEFMIENNYLYNQYFQ